MIRTNIYSTALLVILTISCLSIDRSLGELQESERVAEFHARNHRWPPLPSDYIPSNSPGWRSAFERRFEQTAQIADEASKYNAYMCAVHSALIAPNFTEYGWGLTRAPSGLVAALSERLARGLALGASEEEFDYPVRDEFPLELPLMVPIGRLSIRAMRELRPIHEVWSGVELVANNAYGLRVYRNHSNLQMHVDESSTHIISSILHVGHDPQGEPWPLVIEDLHGNTNEVFLEAGDLLLYESSKCFHGRPRRYNGRWYSSLFTHYYPVDWDAERVNLDAHYWVPPDWYEVPEHPVGELEKLEVTETSFKEPNCKHGWCGVKGALKWQPFRELKFGKVVSGDGKIRSLGIDDSREGEEL